MPSRSSKEDVAKDGDNKEGAEGKEPGDVDEKERETHKKKPLIHLRRTIYAQKRTMRRKVVLVKAMILRGEVEQKKLIRLLMRL